MKRFLSYFFVLALVTGAGFGCAKSDIDEMKKDITQIEYELTQKQQEIKNHIERLDGVIDGLDEQLAGDISDGDAQTLTTAKAYAEQLRDALKTNYDAQLALLNDFVNFDNTGKLVVNDGINQTLNGTYSTLEDLVAAIALRLKGYDGRIESLEDVLDALDETLADLKEEILEEVEDMLAEEILGVEKKMQDMVTGLSIVPATGYQTDLDFQMVTVLKDYTFGTGGDQVTFTHGDIISEGTSDVQMIVKVTPNQADITNADWRLIDSQGTDYSDVFDITATPFSGGILTRAEATGLWVVDFKFADGKGRADLPATAGALLSLGIVNNMVDQAATDRLVSTDFNITVASTEGTHTSLYDMDAVRVLFHEENVIIEHLLSELPNRVSDNLWTTEPDVTNPNGVAHIGGDDRTAVTTKVLSLDPSGGGKLIVNFGIGTLPYKWYIEFDPGFGITGASGDMGVLLDGTADATINIPYDAALHRRKISFRMHAVNEDGTVAVEGGTSFVVEFRCQNVTLDPVNFTLTLDNTYSKDDLDVTFNADAPQNIDLDLGFDNAFMAALGGAYSIQLAGPTFVLDNLTQNQEYTNTVNGVVINNEFLGILDNGNGDQTLATGWDVATALDFSGLDPKAMTPGDTYTGKLVLTEAAAWGAHTGIADPITITIPLTVTLETAMTFGLNDMNYKQNMGADNNLITWPVLDPATGQGTYDFDTAFAYALSTTSANVRFYTPNPPMDITGHVATIPNVSTQLSTPGTMLQHTITAAYRFGPVFGSTYGGKFIEQSWDNGNNGRFYIELRNRMDWVTEIDANPTYSFMMLTAIPADLIVFEPVADSGLETTTFTLATAITYGWVLDPATGGGNAAYKGSAYTTTGDSVVDKYFTLSFNADGSLYVMGTGTSPDAEETIILTVEIYDAFGKPHTYTQTINLE